MGGYETLGRLVTTLPRASNEASSGGKTGIFSDFDFFTASHGAVPANENKILVAMRINGLASSATDRRSVPVSRQEARQSESTSLRLGVFA